MKETKNKKQGLIKRFIEGFFTAETLRYFIVGLSCGVIINLGIYYLLANLVFPNINLPFFIKNANALGSAIGWIVATILTFLGNKYYVFRSHETRLLVVLKEFFGTVGARGFSFLVTTFGMKFLVDMNILGISLLERNGSEYISKYGAISAFFIRALFGAFEIAFNYIMNKFVVFKKSDKTKAEE